MAQKIAVILGSNIHWAPYYYRYEQLLCEAGVDFDLVYWNREAIKEECKANLVSFDIPDVSNNKNPMKVWKFIAFSYFVEKTIKKNKYDKLIFLGTHGCAVCFCAGYLSKHYKNKMWIDIRDDEYEWFPPFYWGEKKSIEASYATAISSYEYTRFLPPHDYLYMHNIDPHAEEMQRNFAPTEDPDGSIRISFIGNVRYFEQNVKIIKQLGNDNRFKLQFYGKGSERLQAYCTENGVTNVDFAGAFPQKDTLLYYNKTDIINNAYGNETLNLQTALSNKLYYALFLKMPLLVSANTHMERLAQEYNLGYTFSEDEKFADKLYDWYICGKQGEVKPAYETLWNKVNSEDKACIEKLRLFMNE